MKINTIWEIKLNELEGHFIVSMFIGVLMFLGGLFWDFIVQRNDAMNIVSSKGLGWMQICWCFAWGMFVLWSSYLMSKWGEK